jgi:hypothetical protein
MVVVRPNLPIAFDRYAANVGNEPDSGATRAGMTLKYLVRQPGSPGGFADKKSTRKTLQNGTRFKARSLYMDPIAERRFRGLFQI